MASIKGFWGVERGADFDDLYIPVPESGCWLWIGNDGSGGYGRFAIEGTGKMMRPHRYAYEREYGPIPAGLQACHKCDTRLCVNPHHLFLGDHAANAADMRAKKRSLFGVRNSNAKLDDVTILRIKRRRDEGVSVADIAVEFGISWQHTYKILSGVRWGHVAKGNGE